MRQTQLFLEKACIEISSRKSEPLVGTRGTKPQFLMRDVLVTTVSAMTTKTLPWCCCAHENTLLESWSFQQFLPSIAISTKTQIINISVHGFLIKIQRLHLKSEQSV